MKQLTNNATNRFGTILYKAHSNKTHTATRHTKQQRPNARLLGSGAKCLVRQSKIATKPFLARENIFIRFIVVGIIYTYASNDDECALAVRGSCRACSRLMVTNTKPNTHAAHLTITIQYTHMNMTSVCKCV